MEINLIVSPDSNCSLTVYGMTPMEFDRLRMIIRQEWESEDRHIGEKLAVTEKHFIRNPIDDFLSGLTS